MVKEDVETVVNKIEDIDSKIESLTQEKEKLTEENNENLLRHDLETVEKSISDLESLKTKKAIEILEEYGLIEEIKEVHDMILEEIK